MVTADTVLPILEPDINSDGIEDPLADGDVENLKQCIEIKDNGPEELQDESNEEDPLSVLVSQGLSQLGLAADGTTQVFLNLSLTNKELDSVAFLSKYQHIQVLDVSHNKLTEFDAVGSLLHLISLNASHNQLRKIIQFTPPDGLREINFSNNKISSIGDLSCHALLNTILLDHNKLTDMGGLSQCKQLKNLSLSNNNIVKISGLDCLPIKQLDLSCNSIRKIENISSCQFLQYLNLSNNSIRSLRGLQGLKLLEELDIKINNILDLAEIRYLRDLKMLRILNLNQNPIQDITDYRLSMLLRLPVLVELDEMLVFPEEKVAAVNLFTPKQELVASRDHMYNLMMSYQQPVSLLDSSLENSDPYPILIITGPIGVGKKMLAHKLSQEFPNCFKVGVGHTSRDLCANLPYDDIKCEQNRVHYHFVPRDEFEAQRQQGRFLQTCLLHGSYFGISRQAIEDVAEQGLACVLTMELEGVFAFKKTHFEPRYVLVLPESKSDYEEKLKNSNRYPESQIFSSVRKVDKYIEMNQNHPGYFDATIVSDSFEEMYMQLKNTVLDYLGITPPSTARYSYPPARQTPNKNRSEARLLSREKNSSYGMRNTSTSSLLKAKDSLDLNPSVSPAAIASYERRYEKTKAAMMGMTSSFDEQLEKVRTPTSTATVPLVRGHANLMKPCEENIPHTTPAKIKTTETKIVKPKTSSEDLDVDETSSSNSTSSSNLELLNGGSYTMTEESSVCGSSSDITL